MRFRRLLPLGLCLASSAVVAGVHAQNGTPKPARKAPTPPTATDNGAVIVSGEKSISDGDTETSKLTGNVTVTQVGEDFILYSQKLVYNDQKKRAFASEKLRVETRDSTIRGNLIDADFNTKVMRLTGNVTISTHGKGDGITGNRPAGGLRAQFTSKPSKLFCDQVDWDYETREAVLTGHIRMTQGKNSGRCDRIEFDEGQNVTRLMGNVRFTDDKGQSYATRDLTIYNNENRIETSISTLHFKPATTTANATARPPKPRPTTKKAPAISDDELGLFNVKPSPIPTLRPEPTPVPPVEPTPEPAEETPAADTPA